MNTTIQELARKSAELYYNFATEKHKSAVEYPVHRICPAESGFELYVAMPIRALDHLFVQIRGVLYEEPQIRILDYDPEKRMVRIFADKQCAQLLCTVSADEVVLVSDLRFLIRRVRAWYEEYGSLVGLPQRAPSVLPFYPASAAQKPSEDQRRAMEGALKAPFSYIWGAPGTGKTRMVLAGCILSYVKQQKRILIAAPTNRALEQVLNGVLPALEENGIKQNVVLRMGIPTREFAERYPAVCENHQLLQKVKELEAMLASAREKLRQAEALAAQYQGFQEYLKQKARFEKIAADGFGAVERLEQLEKESDENARLEHTLHTEMKTLKAKAAVLQGEYSFYERELSKLRQKKQRYEKGMARKLFPHTFETLSQKEAETEKRLKEQEEKACALEQKTEENSRALEERQGRRQAFGEESERQRERLETVRSVLDDLELIEAEDTDEISAVLMALFQGQKQFAEKERTYKGLDLKAAEKAASEREGLMARISELEHSMVQMQAEKKTRMGRCLIMAATIDGCLTKVLPDGDFKPEHVFLDEAGYASLIKGAALSAYHCPMTLLGDHMQLPPVCEINDRQLEEEEGLRPVVLWAQSALYLEELFTKDFSALCSQYFHHQPPSFKDLQKYDLIRSYRMGTRLAAVLAGEVYSSRLVGATEHQTKILYINVPREKNRPNEDKNRYNEGECRAIAAFVDAHRDLEIGVITPYKNQKNALRRLLPEEIEVNTIHGSQGREWDCVMISVVDSADKWFTDSLSKLSNGKKIINTAVSRAKKYLILVCDAEYWASREKQLLGKLLSIGREVR